MFLIRQWCLTEFYLAWPGLGIFKVWEEVSRGRDGALKWWRLANLRGGQRKCCFQALWQAHLCSVCMCVSIFVHVCLCDCLSAVCIYLCVLYLYLFVCMCVAICVSVFVDLYLYVRLYLSIYVCVSWCLSLDVCVSVCLFLVLLRKSSNLKVAFEIHF